MKKLLIPFLLLLSTISFSEEYNCAGAWNEEVEIKTYTRNGDHFIHNTLGKVEITNETVEKLIMHLAFSDAIFIVIIDKINKNFMENYIDLNDLLPAKPLIGNCLIQY